MCHGFKGRFQLPIRIRIITISCGSSSVMTQNIMRHFESINGVSLPLKKKVESQKISGVILNISMCHFESINKNSYFLTGHVISYSSSKWTG